MMPLIPAMIIHFMLIISKSESLFTKDFSHERAATRSFSQVQPPYNLGSLMNASIQAMFGKLNQYATMTIIAQTFIAHDTNGDDKLDRNEFNVLLGYLGVSLPDENITEILDRMDDLVVDGLLQEPEFFYWFTWQGITNITNLEQSIEIYKLADKTNRKLLENRMFAKSSEAPEPFMRMGNTVPTPAQILSRWGVFTEWTTAMKVMFYHRTFDFNWDQALDREELGYLCALAKPLLTVEQVDWLLKDLDRQEKDGVIQLIEFFWWFSPLFNGRISHETPIRAPLP